MIFTVLKTTHSNVPPKNIKYRSYKSFSEESFKSDLTLALSGMQTGSLEDFQRILLKTLNKHAPLKSRLIRGNNKPHVNKSLRKAIILRSRLKNIKKYCKFF